MKSVFVVLFLFVAQNLFAQFYKGGQSIGASTEYIGVNYDNDVLFGLSDRNYTFGFDLFLASPKLQKVPLLFSRRPASEHVFRRSTFGFSYNGFTPEDISSAEIQYGDRPYAASLLFHMNDETAFRQIGIRKESEWTVGLIGPLAGGHPIQSGLHKMIDATQPNGWQYQIGNAPVVNYRLKVGKQLLRTEKLEWEVAGQGMIGTLYGNLLGETSLKIGRFNSVYDYSSTASKGESYLTLTGRGVGSFYDATLQGSVLNRENPYVLRSSEMQKVIGNFSARYTKTFGPWAFGLSYNFLSPELKGGKVHQWTGVHVGLAL